MSESFWDKLAARIIKNPFGALEAQSSGDRKDNQGGGSEAATPPITFTSRPVVYPVAVTHEPGTDAPLLSAADAGEGTRPRIVADPETYIGWRWWKVSDSGYLRSVTFETRWDGPTFHADHKPTPSNSHGIYSLRDRCPTTGYRQWPGAMGEIEYSGTVVVGEDGFRGEVATIRSLWMERDLFHSGLYESPDAIYPNMLREWPSKDLVKALEDRYQVTVQFMDPPDPPDEAEDLRRFMYSASSAPIYSASTVSHSPGLQQALGGLGLSGLGQGMMGSSRQLRSAMAQHQMSQHAYQNSVYQQMMGVYPYASHRT